MVVDQNQEHVYTALQTNTGDIFAFYASQDAKSDDGAGNIKLLIDSPAPETDQGKASEVRLDSMSMSNITILPTEAGDNAQAIVFVRRGEAAVVQIDTRTKSSVPMRPESSDSTKGVSLRDRETMRYMHVHAPSRYSVPTLLQSDHLLQCFREPSPSAELAASAILNQNRDEKDKQVFISEAGRQVCAYISEQDPSKLIVQTRDADARGFKYFHELPTGTHHTLKRLVALEHCVFVVLHEKTSDTEQLYAIPLDVRFRVPNVDQLKQQADAMLDAGAGNDLERLLGPVPDEKQANRWIKLPTRVKVFRNALPIDVFGEILDVMIFRKDDDNPNTPFDLQVEHACCIHIYTLHTHMYTYMHRSFAVGVCCKCD